MWINKFTYTLKGNRIIVNNAKIDLVEKNQDKSLLYVHGHGLFWRKTITFKKENAVSITDASDAIELLKGEKKCTQQHINALLFAITKGARKELWKGAYEICLLHKMMFPAGGATRFEDRVFAKGSAHSYAEPPTYPLLEKF